MEEFIKDICIAIGGAVGFFLLLMAFGKDILQKKIESVIDLATSKKLSEFNNKINRHKELGTAKLNLAMYDKDMN